MTLAAPGRPAAALSGLELPLSYVFLSSLVPELAALSLLSFQQFQALVTGKAFIPRALSHDADAKKPHRQLSLIAFLKAEVISIKKKRGDNHKHKLVDINHSKEKKYLGVYTT